MPRCVRSSPPAAAPSHARALLSRPPALRLTTPPLPRPVRRSGPRRPLPSRAGSAFDQARPSRRRRESTPTPPTDGRTVGQRLCWWAAMTCEASLRASDEAALRPAGDGEIKLERHLLLREGVVTHERWKSGGHPWAGYRSAAGAGVDAELDDEQEPPRSSPGRPIRQLHL
jgi:hypothetical protein